MKHLRVIIGGLAATAAMTLFLLAAPLVGLPAMNTGEMLGAILGNSEVAGWVMHFVIGVFFAYIYALFFNEWLPVINPIARGVLFGIIVLVFSEIVLTVINLAGFFTWDMKKDMAISIFTNMLACFVYGSVLGGIMKEYRIENGLHWEKKKYLKFKEH